jgi:hypothetical protein
MTQKPDPLTELAILNGTDKFGMHDYTPNYWTLFRDRRDQALNLLEIGVGGYAEADRGGESLALWRDFFPKARITGIDIQKKTMDLGPRVDIRRGSQVDAEFLARLVAEKGPFDIIIDDGSHRNEHVIETFELLFEGMNPGGIYVVEDTQTAFHPRFGGSLERTAPHSLAYFSEMFVQVDHMEADAFHKTGPHRWGRLIIAMHRFHNMVALTRGDNTYPSNFAFRPDHAQVTRNLGMIRTTLASGRAAETGLLAGIRLLTALGTEDDIDGLENQLRAKGAASRTWYQFAIARNLAKDRTQEAGRLAAEAVAGFPGDAAILVLASRVATRAGDHAGALTSAAGAHAAAPRDRQALMRLAQCHLTLRDGASALEATGKLLKLYKDFAPGHLLAARAAALSGDRTAALKAVDAALLHQPGMAAALKLRADLAAGTEAPAGGEEEAPLEVDGDHS